MKIKPVYVLAFLPVLLAACGTNTDIMTEEETDLITEISTETDNIATGENDEEKQNEIITLNANYNSPAGETAMTISYTIDELGNISSISVEGSTPQIRDLNNGIQTLIGKPLQEAQNIVVAGASLATQAFRDALKE
ncbi:MAG: hypothetical protein PHU61_00910 [Candidatus Absconditabacteria bacterium]|nr:hypothetical protein [Candidatus Absconditabacteria bacterium]MDD3868431.1 hypothetical protein [Candidatus Absconditabacteria bacterium]MDD4714045.1 hypothetical protein [Candidatus Absconditabacteria bacterium]